MAKRKKRRFLDPQLLEEAARTVAEEAADQNAKVALIGGFAMQFYGSPRLTGDVDVVSSLKLSESDVLKHMRRLVVGGDRFLVMGDVPVDVVFRADEYAALYEEALQAAQDSGEGFLVVTPEYLAAMKLAARRPKDELDLLWLLSQPDLVNIDDARNIVRRHVGGRFGVDEFNSVLRESQWRKGEFVDDDENGSEE